MFTLSLVFLYGFSMNQANTEVGSHEVEKNFEFQCALNMAGTEFATPVEIKFDATVPDRVKAGGELYLSNVSVSMLGEAMNSGDEPLIENTYA